MCSDDHTAFIAQKGEISHRQQNICVTSNDKYKETGQDPRK